MQVQSRTCTHKYYSNVSGYTTHLCSTGSNYPDTASCTGTADACASGNTSTSCTYNDSTCTATCANPSGTKTGTCTVTSTKISYTCSSYGASTSCSKSCTWRHLEHIGLTCPQQCPGQCEMRGTTVWYCAYLLWAENEAALKAGGEGGHCWCKE